MVQTREQIPRETIHLTADEDEAQRARARAADLIAFIDRGVTPYHATREIARRLEEGGFLPLDEREAWTLSPGDRRYVVRGGSSIVAFQIGHSSPASAGFLMVGAHTDSPNLKLKPRAAYTKNGYRQIGVEVYGGVLWHTWLDRDLSIAGRVAFTKDGQLTSALVDLERPLLRIPNLAIHLNRQVNTDGLKLNPQDHLPPIWGLEGEETGEDGLMAMIAEAAGIDPADIVDHDLALYDTQHGTLGGAGDAFVLTARLDNLASCHSGLTALLSKVESPADATRMLVFYDHEEVGSRSAHGAAGPFLRTTVERVLEAHVRREPQGFARAIAASFLVSADMAHAVHPNYSDRHEPRHMPLIGKGPVVKSNANQSYATDGESAARFTALCRKAGFEPQHFVTRTDLGCGSTIGPITAAELGVKTVDCGNPMMSMHSVREMAGTLDVERMHQALASHFGG